MIAESVASWPRWLTAARRRRAVPEMAAGWTGRAVARRAVREDRSADADGALTLIK